MSEEGTGATALGGYRLRTHELAPVLVPRARAASSSSREQKEFTAVSPARPRGSIGRLSSPRRGRTRLESVAFDPFSGSESFRLLLQNPETSSARREDPRAVSTFRQWLSHSFPQLLRTLRALGMTRAPSTMLQDETFANEPTTNPCSSPFDDIKEESANVAEYEREVDCDECWRLLLRYATVLSATPSETLALQGITSTESVYFLLNGHCELSFRPMLLRGGTPPSAGAIELGCSGRPVMQLRELAVGDCFGLDAAAFGFEHHLSTARAGSARQRNFLGLREEAFTFVLCLPYSVVRQLQLLQHRHQNKSLPPAFPYSFAPEAELFLRNTFLFGAMADSSRRFLAAHLHHVVVAQQEYLFTPGQPVRVFIVISGQLTLGAPREERTGTREGADLELELLQTHDSVGLAETLRLATSFDRYCVVTSASGARAFALPSTVLLMVLAHESASLTLIHEWISQRKSWVELRRATALAQRKKLATEGSQHIAPLTLATQRRSKLTCSRCGWAGHVSTSSSCVRVNNLVDEFGASPTSLLDRRSREGSRAARQQARTSHSPTQPTQPIPPTSPDNPGRTSAHRRLQVDSMALRALRISTISVAGQLSYYESIDREVKPQFTQTASIKDDTVRECALTQSYRRLEVVLQQNKTPPVTPREKMNGKIRHMSS